MIAACARVGANAPKGAGELSLSGVKQDVLGEKRRINSRFWARLQRYRRPCESRGPYAAASRFWAIGVDTFVKNSGRVVMRPSFPRAHREPYCASPSPPFFDAAFR